MCLDDEKSVKDKVSAVRIKDADSEERRDRATEKGLVK